MANARGDREHEWLPLALGALAGDIVASERAPGVSTRGCLRARSARTRPRMPIVSAPTAIGERERRSRS
jgi:hypothetical protein